MPIRRWPERRAVVLTVATLLFAGCFAIRMAGTDPASGVSLLFVVPTALVALELGVTAGFGAAALSAALVVVWIATRDVDVSTIGVLTRSLVFVAVGALAGRFSDRMREATGRQTGLLESGLALAQLGDPRELPSIVASHARAAVDAAGVSVVLADGLAADAGPLGSDPVRVPILLRGATVGELAIEPSRPLTAEDRAALDALAAQAAIAAENQRLLNVERERGALEVQLGEAHERLTERGDQLREVLEGQEDERRELAYQLHEESAQAMAAVLMGLRALQRDVGSDALRDRLDVLRRHVDATLVDLRSIAVSLRPPVLDLGLEVALHRLGDRARDRGLERLEVALGGREHVGSREREAAIYRVAEEALEAFERPRSAAIVVRGSHLEIVVRGGTDDRLRRERVAVVGARAELVDGVVASNGELRVSIPLAPDA